MKHVKLGWLVAVIAGATLSMAVLTACAPLTNLVTPVAGPVCPPTYTCEQLADGWRVTADESKPGFVIGSSRDITAFTANLAVGLERSCEIRLVAGPESTKVPASLACNAPNTVTITTAARGTIQVYTLDAPPLKPSATVTPVRPGLALN
jgi:hypothetical protein